MGRAVLDGQLQLFPDQKPANLLDTLFVRRHQIGHYRLPWDTAAGELAGDLVPAWRCCRCGDIEMSRYLLVLSHGCEDVYGGCRGTCRYRPAGKPRGPYAMDAHWIPPAGWTEASDG